MPEGALEPETIYSNDGSIWLGEHDAVLAVVQADEGPGFTLAACGWMQNTGWDSETYKLKREFIAESGFTSWWVGCQGPIDGQERASCRRAWKVVSPAREDGQ